MGTNDISWFSLAIGAAVLIIPAIILYAYKTRLVKPMAIAFVRMSVQLTLVGIYLKYIFEFNSMWLNFTWLFIMIVAASITIINRSDLKLKYFIMPVTLGVLANILLNSLIFVLVLEGPENFFKARYLIPISGMIIGNCLTSSIIGLRSFYNALVKTEDTYRYYLISGADKNEALFPYISDALKSAFSPSVASTATIGLIWLPGMMTGQLLGGSSPLVAIKYQILIMISIFAGGVITTYISLFTSKKYSFDSYDMLDRRIYLK